MMLIAGLMAGAVVVPAPGLAAPSPPGAAPAIGPQSRDGQNRRVRIHNQTGWTVVRLQAADARSRAWQGDVVGDQVLATGASRVATIDDGSGACVYMFRAEFSNGQALERGPINVCEIADYYLTR